MNNSPWIIRHIKLVIGAVILLAVGLFLSQYGFLSISATGASPDTTYTLAREGSNNQVITGGSITRLVKKGSYEITANNKGNSGFALAKISGYLTKKSIVVKLEPEKNRSFVGDNPSLCNFYVDILYSYDCNGNFASVVAHTPANGGESTYSQPVSSTIEGDIEDTLTTPAGVLALVRLSDLESGASHSAYILGPGAAPTGNYAIKGLNPNKTYLLKNYQNGFIAYDDDLTQVYYFQSVDSQPGAIAISVNNQLGSAYSLEADGSQLVLARTDTKINELNLDKPANNIKTQVVIYDQTSGQTKSVNLQGPYYRDVHTCGQKFLCALNSHRLEVFDISGTKPKFKYSISGVQQLNSLGDSLILTKGTGVMLLKPDSATANVLYSFGSYSPCGLNVSGDKLIVCLEQGNFHTALKLDLHNNFADLIDKQTYSLRADKNVKAVSIYGNFIYVSANYGEPVYDKASNSFGPDPQVKKTVDAAIDQKIKDLGIDEKKYQVVKTF
jgi:hypothetical protein